MNVLFVCTGNICRSPMAEGLFRHRAEQLAPGGVEVSSAGTWGLDGEPATSAAQEVMRMRGIDISGHIARTLTADLLDAADLVVVMTSVHERDIHRLDPDARHKVRLVKEFGSLEVPPGSGLGVVLEAKRPEWIRATDLDDPYGMPVAVYERTAQYLEPALELLARTLFGYPSRP